MCVRVRVRVHMLPLGLSLRLYIQRSVKLKKMEKWLLTHAAPNHRMIVENGF